MPRCGRKEDTFERAECGDRAKTGHTGDGRAELSGAVTRLQEREWFARRKDKLLERRRTFAPASAAAVGTTAEQYAPGAAYGVRELRAEYAADTAGATVLARRTASYYASARLDSLVSKDEIVGVKTIERFKGRPDRLTYRSATYGPAPDDGASQVRADGTNACRATEPAEFRLWRADTGCPETAWQGVSGSVVAPQRL